MPNINSFSIVIETGNVPGAGTDDYVYIGLCGREFCADTRDNDFETATVRTYQFGRGSNVLVSDRNDPRNPQIRSENVDKFPVYIRIEPSGPAPEWNLKRAVLKAGGLTYSVDFPDGIWLQQDAGKTVYLSKN